MDEELKGATDKQIKKAEKQLGINLPTYYVELLKYKTVVIFNSKHSQQIFQLLGAKTILMWMSYTVLERNPAY